MNHEPKLMIIFYGNMMVFMQHTKVNVKKSCWKCRRFFMRILKVNRLEKVKCCLYLHIVILLRSLAIILQFNFSFSFYLQNQMGISKYGKMKKINIQLILFFENRVSSFTLEKQQHSFRITGSNLKNNKISFIISGFTLQIQQYSFIVSWFILPQHQHSFRIVENLYNKLSTSISILYFIIIERTFSFYSFFFILV